MTKPLTVDNNSMDVLIVDDSRSMRRILRTIIEDMGFTAVEADHGVSGLEQLQKNPGVALVLVDWNMPEMDGLEFIESVRSDEAYKNLKLVMVTSETEPTRMARALMAGADEFVMKPFTREMLVDKLKLIGVDLACYTNTISETDSTQGTNSNEND